MNPIPPQPPSGGGSTQVVISSGTGSVPYHQHPLPAITGDWEDVIPERLAIRAVEVTDCNAALDTGWWSADNSAANTPDTSFWVGQTIFYSIDTTTGLFVVQMAHEVTGAYRSFKRNLNVVTWTAWQEFTLV